MPARALLGLIVCNLIWSVHPVMGKLVLEDFAPAHGAWLRYSCALAAYSLFALARRIGATRAIGSAFFLPRSARDWCFAVLLGFFTFCFSPILQFTGLEATRATDNALIIAMEPLVLVFLAWVFLRQRITARHAAGFAIALAGFGLLTGISPHLKGNAMILLSLTGEAMFSVLGLKLIDRHPSMAVFGTALAIGVALLTLFTFAYAGPPHLSAFTIESALGVAWLGILGTMGAYLFWLVLLAEAPVASLAITLFVQPLAGTLWGCLFLGDRLGVSQAIGGVLILGSVLISAQVRVSPRPSQP